MRALRCGAILGTIVLLTVPSQESKAEPPMIVPLTRDAQGNVIVRTPPPVSPSGSTGAPSSTGVGQEEQTVGQTGIDILSADWSVQAKPSVVERGFGKRSVARLVEEFCCVPEEGESVKEDDIENFRWIDIDKDGVYELVVTGSESQRSFGGLVVYKSVSGKKAPYQSIAVAEAVELDQVMRDLDGDGIPELILPTLLAVYSGQGRAIWTTVYKWDGERFVDASRQFRDFYQQRIVPDLEARIQELSNPWEPPAGMVLSPQQAQLSQTIHEEQLAAAWTVRDKIARITGEDPLAGVERARTWMKSPNAHLRRNALSVFEDIPDGYFKADIQMLAADPSPIVSSPAQIALKRLEKKRP